MSANPKSTEKLRLDEEVREIQAALERAKRREQFEIITRWAVRVDDLRRALLDHEPQIVHFSGHGTGSEGLALENNLGQPQLVSTAALARLFKSFKNTIQCVFLNACYSKEQSEAIHQHIDYVVGMNQAIGDQAAIEFAIGFYDALGAGRSIEDSFELGCTAIDLEGIPESSTPVLKINPRLLLSPSKEGIHREEIESEESLAPEPQAKSVKVFMSYRSQDPDQSLAEQFYRTLKTAGHDVFMAAESILLGENWSQRIDSELEQCDYFLLLLSEKSAVSEMVTEEVLRAKQLQDIRADNRPVILPIRVNFPISSPLNYNLRGYLQQIQQREWNSPADTPKILNEILSMLFTGKAPVLEEQLQAQSPAIETPSKPPLPVAEPELPEGQVDLASRFYVDRPPIESRCYEQIERPGALIRIKAPRQMGKTSLMARILHHADSQGCLKVQLSFQLADGKIFTDLDQFLRWFCSSVGRRLKLPNKLTDFWDDVFGSKDNCTAYFEEYLLAEINKPLALGLDEVDLIFQHREIASDFFGLLRAWHEEAKSRDIWKRLRLVLVHSTEIYIPLNINQSPFNVGLPIELPEFTLEQVIDLAHRHGLNWNAAQAQQLISMVGGHPYLVRVGLYSIARHEMTLSQLLQVAIRLWNRFGQQLAQFKRLPSNTSVQFSPNGQQIATFNKNDVPRLWDLSGKEIAQFKEHQGKVLDVQFRPDSQQIATLGEDGVVYLWNKSGQLGKVLQKPEGKILDMRFSPDSQLLVAKREDGTAQLLNTSSQQSVILKEQQGEITDVQISPNGQEILSLGEDGNARLWNKSGQQVNVLRGQEEKIWNVKFSPDGQLLAVLETSGSVRLLNKAGQQMGLLEGAITQLEFSPNNQYIATLETDKTVRLWNKSGQQIAQLKESREIKQEEDQEDQEEEQEEKEIWDIKFSPNSQYLATIEKETYYTKERIVTLWDLLGKQVKKFKGEGLDDVQFSPNGKILITQGNGTARLWWTKTGEQITQFREHQGLVIGTRFSPDGQFIATVGEDGTVRLWDISGRQVAQFQGHKGKVTNILFSPDSQQLVVLQEDGTLRLWEVNNLEQLLARGCMWLYYYFNNPKANLSKEDRELCSDKRQLSKQKNVNLTRR